MTKKMVYLHQIVEFEAIGTIVADHRDAVAVNIQCKRCVKTPFDFKVTANVVPHHIDKRYHLVGVKFEGDYTLEQLILIGGAIAQFSDPVQKILKSIYETYINA